MVKSLNKKKCITTQISWTPIIQLLCPTFMVICFNLCSNWSEIMPVGFILEYLISWNHLKTRFLVFCDPQRGSWPQFWEPLEYIWMFCKWFGVVQGWVCYFFIWFWQIPKEMQVQNAVYLSLMFLCLLYVLYYCSASMISSLFVWHINFKYSYYDCATVGTLTNSILYTVC